MSEDYTKTPLKQRLIIGLIAFAMVASTVAMYVGVILSARSGQDSKTPASDRIEELNGLIAKKQQEIITSASPITKKYFPILKEYKKYVKAYNAKTANTAGLVTKDLKVGNGRTLKAKDENYYAFYIGFCANESIFDSSFDDFKKPTSLKPPIPGAGLIKGWMEGIHGMKLGGVRELSIPSELAYKDQEICGAKNSPIRFILITIEEDATLKKLNQELISLQTELQKLYFKIYQ